MVKQDFKLLAQYRDDERFRRLKKKYAKLSKEELGGEYERLANEIIEAGAAAYIASVKEHLRVPIIEAWNSAIEEKLRLAEGKIRELEEKENERKEKQKEKERYERRARKRN